MPLAIGARFGPYDIVSPLGAGGMGEVYRADDARLKRQVALKILPLELAADPERLPRLQRAAEGLAPLQHPPIAGALRPPEATAGQRPRRGLVRGPAPAR